MAKRELDWRYVAQPAQFGGITTGTVDHPQPLGGEGCRVAFVETGAGLRFTVALDRGGDIIDATYRGRSLAWLSPTGLSPGSFAFREGMEWLRSWPGGLVTTCGPLHIGRMNPDVPHGEGLHGHHSHVRAAVLSVENPSDVPGGVDGMAFAITMRLDDVIMFGPHLETVRRVSGRIGEASLTIEDTVTNRGNTAVDHHQLYHINLGYPALAPGARIVAGGQQIARWGAFGGGEPEASDKVVADILEAHRGVGESGFAVRPLAEDAGGEQTVGLVNRAEDLAIRITYDGDTLEKLGVWQHFGPKSYVCGIEPYHGSLIDDDFDASDPSVSLAPGASRGYRVKVAVGEGDAAMADLLSHDRPVTR